MSSCELKRLKKDLSLLKETKKELKELRRQYKKQHQILRTKLADIEYKTIGITTLYNIKLLKFLRSLLKIKSNNFYLLPYTISSNIIRSSFYDKCHNIGNINLLFEYYKSLCDISGYNKIIIDQIVELEKYFDSNEVYIKIIMKGLRSGYKGDETFFDKVTDFELSYSESPFILKDNQKIKCVIDKKNLYFFIGNDILHYNRVSSIDWGEYDTIESTARYETNLICIKFKDN